MLKISKQNSLKNDNPNFAWSLIPSFASLDDNSQKCLYIYFCLLPLATEDFTSNTIIQYTTLSYKESNNIINNAQINNTKEYEAKNEITKILNIPKYEPIRAIASITHKMAQLIQNANIELNPKDPVFIAKPQLFDMCCKEYDRLLKTQEALFLNIKRLQELSQSVAETLMPDAFNQQESNPIAQYNKLRRAQEQ